MDQQRGSEKHDEDRRLEAAHEPGVARGHAGDGAGEPGFQGAGRTEPADGDGLFVKRDAPGSQEPRQEEHQAAQDRVTAPACPARQLPFGERDAGQEILEKPQRAGPAADQGPPQAADNEQNSGQQKRKDGRRREQGGVVGHQADRAGQGGERAGIAVKDAAGQPMERAARRGQPERQKRSLNPGPPGDPLLETRFFGLGRAAVGAWAIHGLRGGRRRGGQWVT